MKNVASVCTSCAVLRALVVQINEALHLSFNEGCDCSLVEVLVWGVGYIDETRCRSSLVDLVVFVVNVLPKRAISQFAVRVYCIFCSTTNKLDLFCVFWSYNIFSLKCEIDNQAGNSNHAGNSI